MARPATGYHNRHGKRVVGTTTFGGVFGDKGAIIRSANNLGLDGKSIQTEWYDKAANIGNLAHDLFEHYINPDIDEPSLDEFSEEEIEKAQAAFGAAKAWFDNTRMEIIWTEKPLVSEALQYGGTPDALGRTPGLAENEVVIADWKSGGVFDGALFQVAAYKILVEENFPDLKVVGFHIVRFGKDTGDFVHRYYPELDLQVAEIPHMRRIYDVIRATAKRAR